MASILIIEDNRDINMMLAEALRGAGYAVSSAFDGVEGLDAIKAGGHDLVLLDIMLPYMSGDQILREMRSFSDTPVIVLSAKDMVGTKIDLLRMGADDYVTKPFDLGELLARVETSLRRARRQFEADKLITYKDMTLDRGTKTVQVGGEELELTAKEYGLLELLLSNQGKVFTKANLYETVWGEEYLGDDNAVKTHLSNLRSKLKKANPEEEYIETVWGLGYRLVKE